VRQDPFDRKGERGATLVTTALMATGLVVVSGLVADTGAIMYQRTRMQVAADAAALAGAKALLNGRQYAIAQAQDVAAKNGYALSPDNISIQQGSRMNVRLDNKSPSVVARVLQAVKSGGDPSGAAPLTVGAKSTADLHCVSLTYGVRPFGVPEQDFVPGIEYALKQGAGNSVRGNFQALALDGTGASIYRDEILNGAKRTVHVGDMVPTEPGNKAGPTVVAINQLLGNDRTGYRQAVSGARTPRVITVPLLGDSFFQATGRSNVVIAGFARFYVTYTTGRGEVYGRFIDKLSQTQVTGTSLQYSVRLADEQDPVPPPVNPASIQ